MSEIRENLIKRAKIVAKKLADLDALQPGGSPNVLGTAGGTHLDNEKHKEGLYKELANLLALLGVSTISELDSEDDETTFFEVETQIII